MRLGARSPHREHHPKFGNRLPTCRGWQPGGVLDAGCGTGRVAIELAGHGIEVVGVEVDASMLAGASRGRPATTTPSPSIAPPDRVPERDSSGTRPPGTAAVFPLSGDVRPAPLLPITPPGSRSDDTPHQERAIWPNRAISDVDSAMVTLCPE